MINPQMKFVPRTEFERQPFYRGEAEGEAKALLRVLAARNFSPTEEQRQAVLACRDRAQLERWLDASVTAPSIAALLDTK